MRFSFFWIAAQICHEHISHFGGCSLQSFCVHINRPCSVQHQSASATISGDACACYARQIAFPNEWQEQKQYLKLQRHHHHSFKHKFSLDSFSHFSLFLYFILFSCPLHPSKCCTLLWHAIPVPPIELMWSIVIKLHFVFIAHCSLLVCFVCVYVCVCGSTLFNIFICAMAYIS